MDRAGNVGQNLATAVIDTQGLRTSTEASLSQVPQERMHGWGVGTGWSADSVAYLHHGVEIAARQAAFAPIHAFSIG
jgi:hypothetical protein